MVFLLALIVSSSFVCSNLVVSTSMITDTGVMKLLIIMA